MSTLVRHAMTEDPKTLSAAMSAADAAGLMANYDVGAIPVTDEDGSLRGLVIDRDLVVRVLANRAEATGTSLGEIASTSMIEVGPDMDLVEATRLMADHRIRRLPVTKDGKLVGILSLGDAAVVLASKRWVGETLEDVSMSEATAARNDGPSEGTPARVMARRTGANEGAPPAVEA